jgi:hypothetical protein
VDSLEPFGRVLIVIPLGTMLVVSIVASVVLSLLARR